MKFSDYYGIDYDDGYDWFDPILDTDTRLFVDPFLIFKEKAGSWADAHDELIAYFNDAFERLAPVYDKPNSLGYQKVLALMRVP